MMKISYGLIVFVASCCILPLPSFAQQASECGQEKECKTGYTCVQGRCLECINDTYCEGGNARATKCFDGVCSECSKGNHCASGYCNGDGACQNCEADTQCGGYTTPSITGGGGGYAGKCVVGFVRVYSVSLLPSSISLRPRRGSDSTRS